MKHLNKGRTLGRPREQRRALLNSLFSSLVLHKRIEVTLAKAKEMKPFSEKMITKAKKKNLASIRLLKKRLSKQAAKELFDRVAPAVKKRKGGYIRIIRKGWRESDGAEMALVLLVDFSEALEAGVSTDKKDKIKNKKNKQSIKDNEKQ